MVLVRTYAKLILAHTLLHEVTHLDSFGVLAGLPSWVQFSNDQLPPFSYHGTRDWNFISTPGNARQLKIEAPVDFPNTRNAESYAGFALGKYAFAPIHCRAWLILTAQ